MCVYMCFLPSGPPSLRSPARFPFPDAARLGRPLPTAPLAWTGRPFGDWLNARRRTGRSL